MPGLWKSGRPTGQKLPAGLCTFPRVGGDLIRIIGTAEYDGPTSRGSAARREAARQVQPLEGTACHPCPAFQLEQPLTEPNLIPGAPRPLLLSVQPLAGALR